MSKENDKPKTAPRNQLDCVVMCIYCKDTQNEKPATHKINGWVDKTRPMVPVCDDCAERHKSYGFAVYPLSHNAESEGSE